MWCQQPSWISDPRKNWKLYKGLSNEEKKHHNNNYWFFFLTRQTFCHDLFMLFVFIYVYWCPTRFLYQMMFVTFNSNTTGVTCGAGTAYPSGTPEFTPEFSGICAAQHLVSCVVFCRTYIIHVVSPFSFSHFVDCLSLIYDFWLLLWYLQIFLSTVWFPFFLNRACYLVCTGMVYSPLSITRGTLFCNKPGLYSSTGHCCGLSSLNVKILFRSVIP